jgi:hypothetical protein
VILKQSHFQVNQNKAFWSHSWVIQRVLKYTLGCNLVLQWYFNSYPNIHATKSHLFALIIKVTK